MKMDQEKTNEAPQLVLKKKQTFARRVSNMFKDGAKSGPPSLFRHSSMQKIRHCCQNLNLLPYLLYSFEHSKSHPIAVKVNVYLNIVVKHILQSLLLVYTKLQCSILQALSKSEAKEKPAEKRTENGYINFHQLNHVKPKTKHTPLYLVLTIYLALSVVACQLIVVCCLLTLSKYTPGFVFLVSALLFLAMISIRIMFHNSVAFRQMKKRKTKVH